jgi:hypothetical protein
MRLYQTGSRPSEILREKNLAGVWLQQRSPTRTLLQLMVYRLTGSDPSVTDYIFEVPARCLQCGATITEKTLVEWDGSD